MYSLYCNNISPKGWKILRKRCRQKLNLCAHTLENSVQSENKKGVTLWNIELINQWHLVSYIQPSLKCHSKNESPSMWLTIGHVNEYPTMHYFGIPGHTQDFDWVFLVIPVINCIVGNMLTGPFRCSFLFCIAEVNVNVIVSKHFLSF